MRDSNSRHPRCKRGALPTELIALRVLRIVSAASVAVIYSDRAETARAFVKFFCFFLNFRCTSALKDVIGPHHRLTFPETYDQVGLFLKRHPPTDGAGNVLQIARTNTSVPVPKC